MDNENLVKEITTLLKTLDKEYLIFIKNLIKSYIKLKNQHIL